MVIPVSILYKSVVGYYRPVRVSDGPITARCRFINNASWDNFSVLKSKPGLRSELQVTREWFALDPCSCWRLSWETGIQGTTFAITLHFRTQLSWISVLLLCIVCTKTKVHVFKNKTSTKTRQGPAPFLVKYFKNIRLTLLVGFVLRTSSSEGSANNSATRTLLRMDCEQSGKLRINPDFRIGNFHFNHEIALLLFFTVPSFCVRSSYSG